jgi:glycosyltransferase involved in cell wall biosynthesis
MELREFVGGSNMVQSEPVRRGLIALSAPETLITVVIPAYNAESCIDETLRSVRAQTHTNLEIIVVDDGSQDRTGAIAEAHAAVDSRVRVVRQANAGVAAARNNGWRLGAADLIAFVDADDLWSADKIERQLAALRERPDAELVYSWYVVIDGHSRITLRWPGEVHEGNVFRKLLLSNFVGNGSSAIVTRRALETVGGFEPGLRAAGAGGCEDILFYSRVAEHYPFALAAGYHIGYRYIEGNMSSDLCRMLRSWMLVQAELAVRHPDKTQEMAEGLDRFERWLVRRAVQLSEFEWLPGLFAMISSRSLWQAAKIFGAEIPIALRDFHWNPLVRDPRSVTTPPLFEIGTPKVPATLP